MLFNICVEYFLYFPIKKGKKANNKMPKYF